MKISKFAAMALAWFFALLPVHAELQPANLEQLILDPDQNTTLRFTTDLPAAVAYELRDYTGRVIEQAVASPDHASISIPIQQPTGYYEIHFPESDQTFGLISLAPPAGKRDPFFGIDTAMSWLVRGKTAEATDARRDQMTAVLARCGIAMARERLEWGDVAPTGDNPRWQTPRRYDAVRESYLRHHVPLLEMFHDAPQRMGLIGKYPMDLNAAADDWRKIIPHWRPAWGALEVWNEPNSADFGGNVPADQNVPLAHMIRYLCAEQDISLPLGGGVMAGTFNQHFVKVAADNDLLGSVDFFSFHSYSLAPALEGEIRLYRQLMADAGRTSMPLWITECGQPSRRGPARPARQADAFSALDITMKAVEARAGGIARFFAFVYPYLDEGDKNFGMTGKDGSPLRSFAAYAHAARVLTGQHYIGDLIVKDDSLRRARVFARDDRQAIVVLYTGKSDQPDATASVPLPREAILKLASLDGRPLASRDDHAVPIPDGLTYVWVDRGALANHLTADTQMMRLYQLAQPSRHVKQSAPSPIVMRFVPDMDVFSSNPERYLLASDQMKNREIPVRIYNFSGEDRAVTLTLNVAGDPKLTQSLASPTLTVPAHASIQTSWALADLAPLLDDADTQVTLQVTALSPGISFIPHLSFEIGSESTWKQLTHRLPDRTALPLTQLERWGTNISSTGTMKCSLSSDQHWQLNASFTGGDRWVHPRFKLPDDVDLSKAKGLLIRARCMKPGAVRMFLFEPDNVGYFTENAVIPANGRWHAAFIPISRFIHNGATKHDPNNHLDPDQVRIISIGINSDDNINTLEVSDIDVVWNKPANLPEK